MTTRTSTRKASAKRPTKRNKKSAYKPKIKAKSSKAVKASKESTKQKSLKEEVVQPRLRGKKKISDSSNVIVINDDDDDEIEDDHKMCAHQMKNAVDDTEEDDLCKREDIFYDTLGYLPKPINDIAEDVSNQEDDRVGALDRFRGLEPEGISFSTFSTPVAKEEHSGWNLFKLFTSNSQPKQEP